MIRITIELIPNGQVENKRSLGHIDIINDGTGTKKNGNYKYSIVEHDPILNTNLIHYIPIFEGSGVKHRRTDSVFKLLYRVLKHLFKVKGIL